MAKWTKFPHTSKEYEYTAASLKKNWARLHQGDCEPFPKDDAVIEAWIAFHAGRFEDAYKAGLACGEAGFNVANKAANIYANYLEKSDSKKLEIYQEVADRAEQLQAADKKNANAFYLYAYAIGRYGQGISVTKALAQGLGGKVKDALATTLKLAPKHADAHIALAAFQAEVIDKVGSMIASMTYGAKKDDAMKLYKKAIELNEPSAIARIEYANGLVMLDGKKALKEAEALYQQAAECEPMDAMERLDVELAKEELE
jgi:tetratricopeptide (TPR) repeat protein